MTTRVKDVMTRTPYTIDPEAPIATATAVMRERDVRHLPVVSDVPTPTSDAKFISRLLRQLAVGPRLASVDRP